METYLDEYRKCETNEELVNKVITDSLVAWFLQDPNMAHCIEAAVVKVCDEKGWKEPEESEESEE